jgi:hypothetical protein
VRLGDADLREVKSVRDFRSGTFLIEGGQSHIAFDLSGGNMTLLATLG